LSNIAGSGYSVDVKPSSRPMPAKIEMVDDQMAKILRAKTGAERLRIASGMYANARRMLLTHLLAEHPDWDEKRIQHEAARRLSHGAV
jgi:Rv0078B-related antitoxin